MKRKYLAGAAMALGLVSMGTAGVDAVRTFRQGEDLSFGTRPGYVRVTPVPSPAVLRDIETLGPLMKGLRQPAMHNPTKPDLALFGYTPERTGAEDSHHPTEDGYHTNAPSWASYSVSLAFTGATTGFCVIDGVFYQEGATLPTGAQIAKVERDRVLLHEGTLAKWLPVESDLKVPNTHIISGEGL